MTETSIPPDVTGDGTVMTSEGTEKPSPAGGRDVVCIGSVLWDVIGRTALDMRVGSDVPGRIRRQPGGVVLNIAMTLRRCGMHPILLSVLGRDAEGDALSALCQAQGLVMDHVHRSDDLPTDQYMAIEAANGLVAAIADAHSLEAAGDLILAPLRDGRLGSTEVPYSGLVALDGNLTEALLGVISEDPAFARADLRVAPASPGKARRLLPVSRCPNATLYVNLEEAGLLLGGTPNSAKEAGRALVDGGTARVIVTNGAEETADCSPGVVVTATPPTVPVRHITGAGDAFMAAHIAAEAGGAAPSEALETALSAAAAHVSGAETA